MAQYDFYIAGRWRNKDMIKEVTDVVRASGKTAYCFLENAYEGEKVELHFDQDPNEFMGRLEALDHEDELIKKIFKNDLDAVMAADGFLLVLPAGISGHIEAGIAFGAGKKCYAFGVPEKTETLYQIFEKIYPDIDSLKAALAK